MLTFQTNRLLGWPDLFTTDYFFWSGLGDKKIIGFSAANDPSYNSWSRQSLDKLFIDQNFVPFKYAKGLESYLFSDRDGFAVIEIPNMGLINLHGVAPNNLLLESFVIHDTFKKYQYGTDENDILIGSAENDYIDGITKPGCIGPICGLLSGHDSIYGGAGNDVLSGGISVHAAGGYYRDLFIFDSGCRYMYCIVCVVP